MRPSSTSSSEPRPRRRWPWALGAAALALLLLELGVRLLPEQAVLPYEPGEVEYAAVEAHLRLAGPAEVVVLGSSRAREALSVPLLGELLGEALGRAPRVESYAVGGATAVEVEAILGMLLRRGRPRLIVYGLSPRQLWGEPTYAQAARFWDLDDWRADWQAHGPAALGRLPELVRGGLRAVSRLFLCRERAAEAVRELFGAPRLRNPVLGGPSEWHQRGPTLAMLGREVSEARVRWYVSQLLQDGRYPFSQAKREALARVLARCRAAGVELVLVELPLADVLWRFKPAGTRETFLRVVGEEAARAGLPFVRLDELGLALGPDEFLDQSHLNLRGAERLTRALAERALLPRLAPAWRDRIPGDRGGTSP
ncbi:MAG TPA: hypothetical protein PK668_09935 [Myxococcota bacterium]|nr:hypothetical protein [Myxococcota bacterium]HRY93515.1 hypothetical protein [Myxococcota bacterium]HSA21294.1 hypothetical protein [Myxococcota bacterium]